MCDAKSVLSDCDATQQEVIAAGLKLLTMIYGGKADEKLNYVRYKTYMNNTASSSHLLKPERLPPTENSAKFHCLRTHLQVVIWKQLTTLTCLKETDWGWKLQDGAFIPIGTDIEPAPEDLLKIVRCKCKSDSRNPCSSNICSCRKNGLQCVASCKNCCGVSCENRSSVTYSSTDCDTDTASEGEWEYNKDPGDDLDDDTAEFFLPWVTEEVVGGD